MCYFYLPCCTSINTIRPAYANGIYDVGITAYILGNDRYISSVPILSVTDGISEAITVRMSHATRNCKLNEDVKHVYPSFRPHSNQSLIFGFSEWYLSRLDESERLQFLKGTMESYARSVQNEGKTAYVLLYPIMMNLLKGGSDLQALEE